VFEPPLAVGLARCEIASDLAAKGSELARTSAAVPYRCACGTEYLIVIGSADGRWLETVRQAAGTLHVPVIDGSELTFVCGDCGTVHLRNEEESEYAASPEVE
jgi:hypothetical protein